MHDCTVTAATGSSDLLVVVIGHCAAKLPRAVELECAAIAKGERGAGQVLLLPEGRYLLVKPEDKPWLVGGEAWRLLGKSVVDALRGAKLQTATVLVEGSQCDPAAFAEGCILADYRFDIFRSGKDAKRKPITVRFPGHAEAVALGSANARAQNLARELCDLPGNLMNPTTFVARAKKELAGSGLRIQVIAGNAALAKARFPGLVQVGKAGSQPPALLMIRYEPKRVTSRNRVALVGKGITFDTGGISLKPGDKMWEMKGDMGGAAAVLAAMIRIAQTRPSVPVAGYCVLAENMPDMTAQRPGDIYVARNGTSIHVDNTDAEGRLVLADVLTYAAEQGATHIVDAATLTGACLVALGERIAGLMGRHEDFNQLVRQTGQEVGEELWPLPLYGEYRAQIDHPHADVNNTGGRMGGSITAGLFLAEFVPKDVRWVHLDIAGPAIQTGGWRYFSKGMTGFACRTLARIPHKLA